MSIKSLFSPMKNALSYLIASMVIIISSLLAYATDSNADYVPGEIIVKFRQNTDAFSVRALHADAESIMKRGFKKIRVHHMKLSGKLTVEEAVQFYERHPDVEYAEPNFIVAINALPDDTNFSDLWALHNTGQTGGIYDADIDVPEAWDVATGSRNVVIAVVDTGVAYNHPDISANIWTNTGETSCLDGIDNDGNGYIDDCHGWDFLGNDPDPMDFHGHGTHVAGIIGAMGNNGEGITGVMWKAQIMPLRFLGINGKGTSADAVSAILYAGENSANIINLSWGGENYSRALKDAIDVSGAVVVCAAGNSGSNNDRTPHYPSSYSSANIISVSATDSDDDLAFFSNYGKTSVDIAAPGMDIFSSVPRFSDGAPVTVFKKMTFEDELGTLPRSGWKKDSARSSWAVTGGTGDDATNSLEDSPGGNYEDNTTTWAGYMTRINSEKDNRYILSFKWKGELENNRDYLDINYSADGINWDWVDYRTGSRKNFISDSTDAFTDIAERLSGFYLGFGITSDKSINGDGVYLDNITLIRKPINISGFDYTSYSGTSMSAPYVSGVAGLLLAHNPGLAYCQVKNMIINSVDVIPSLSDKVLTGGRLNAFNSLEAVPGGETCNTDVKTVTDENDDKKIKVDEGGGGGKKGCFIATAAYGSSMHPYVKSLRTFRDRYLLTSAYGRDMVSFYYKYSPPVAGVISGSAALRLITRVMLTPVVMLAVFPFESLAVFFALFVIITVTLHRLKKRRISV